MAANTHPCEEILCPHCGKCRSFKHFCGSLGLVQGGFPDFTVQSVITAFAAQQGYAGRRGPLAAWRNFADIAIVTAGCSTGAGILIVDFLIALGKFRGIDDALALVHPPGFCNCNA